MSKKKDILSKKEVELMVSKIKELKMEETYNSFEIKSYQDCDITWSFDLPFGLNSSFIVNFKYGYFWICFYRNFSTMPIRKIESPEDLENLFNAICPEKYRLPFN